MNENSEMAPSQTTVNVRGDSVDNLGHEVIEVRILPQDENRGENTTAVTGNTLDRSESTEDVSQVKLIAHLDLVVIAVSDRSLQ